jgi:hypothetical protein
MWSIECQRRYVLHSYISHHLYITKHLIIGPTNLTTVNTIPGHKNTTLAIARPLSLYLNGLPPYSANSLCVSVAFVPLTYALLAATMYVYASASARASRHAKMAQAFHAIFTDGDSWRSGQKRSKKNAAPKIVATNIPTKISVRVSICAAIECMLECTV